MQKRISNKFIKNILKKIISKNMGLKHWAYLVQQQEMKQSLQVMLMFV